MAPPRRRQSWGSQKPTASNDGGNVATVLAFPLSFEETDSEKLSDSPFAKDVSWRGKCQSGVCTNSFLGYQVGKTLPDRVFLSWLLPYSTVLPLTPFSSLLISPQPFFKPLSSFPPTKREGGKAHCKSPHLSTLHQPEPRVRESPCLLQHPPLKGPALFFLCVCTVTCLLEGHLSLYLSASSLIVLSCVKLFVRLVAREPLLYENSYAFAC